MDGLVSLSSYAYKVSPVVATAKLPESNVTLPQVPLLHVTVKESGAVSVTTTTLPLVIAVPGDVHRITASPEPNNNVELLNELSVKYTTVLAGISCAATNENPSGST